MHWQCNIKINNVFARKITTKRKSTALNQKLLSDEGALEKQVSLEDDDYMDILNHQIVSDL